jgi:dihydroorotase
MLTIKNGRILDPSQGTDQRGDLIIEGRKIKDITRSSRTRKGRAIDASGKWVVPGFIDLHVHLREPGQEAKETIASGTSAAAAGGFTSIVCMPNTNPPIDSEAGIEFIQSRVRTAGVVNVLPTGCITRGQQGEELTEIGDLVQAGAVAITEDGHSVMDSEVMRRALEYSKMFDLPVLAHCEDEKLAGPGVMNEGRMSTILGLRGIPNQAESIIVGRDIQLAELTGGRLHICHVSARESVDLVREAKRKKIRVTCEVTPHHLALTEEALRDYDTSTKVNPPLRAAADQEALWKGIRDGTIDAIATDHAPHTEIEKDWPFVDAPFGVIGMESAIPVVMTMVRKRKGLSFEDLLPLLTTGPAQVLGIDKGTLAPGKDADVTVIDPELTKVFGVEDLRSKSRNCPFLGMELTGFPVVTIVAGKVVYSRL